MAEGRLGLYTHEFYCAPWTYRRMPADLATEFERASLTPFPDVTSYFPGPVAVLRTLKSDVITGLSPATVADLDATRQSWRTDGTHGLLQVLLPQSASNASEEG